MSVFRRRRVATVPEASVDEDGDLTLREFVYLDETSVNSLLASILGPIKAEVTDRSGRKNGTDAGGTAGSSLPFMKAEFVARLNTERSSGQDTVKRANIQSTFRDLYALVSPQLSLSLERFGDPVELLPSVAGAAEWLNHAAPAASRRADDLVRGGLVELEVALGTAAIYRMNAVASAMIEIVQQDAELFGISQIGDLAQVAAIERVLSRLISGLIPITGRVRDKLFVAVGGEEWIVDRSVGDELRRVGVGEVGEIELVGVAEESLFWKDSRRVLFNESNYRVLARLGREGFQREWQPVKLADVLAEMGVDLGTSLDSIATTALSSTSREARNAAESEGPTVHQAQLEFAARLAEALGCSEPTELLREAIVGHDDEPLVPLSVEDRRTALRRVTSAFETAGHRAQPEDSSRIRDDVIRRLLSKSGGANGEVTGQASAADSRTPVRFIDVELMAIYW